MTGAAQTVRRAWKDARVGTGLPTSGLLGFAATQWERMLESANAGAMLWSPTDLPVISVYGSSLLTPLLSGKPFSPVWTRKASESSAPAIAALDGAADARWIKDSLHLSMSDVAALFGVTRKAVYDWFDGTSKPRAHFSERMAAIRSTLQGACTSEQLGLLRQLWSAPLAGEESLAGILKSVDASTASKAKIKAALEELEPRMAELTQRLQSQPRHDLGRAHIEDLVRGV